MTARRRSIIAGAGIGAVALAIAYRIVGPPPVPSPIVRLAPGQYVIHAGAGVDDLALVIAGVDVQSPDVDPLRSIGAVRGRVQVTATVRLGAGGWAQADQYRHWLPERDGLPGALAPSVVADPLVSSMWHLQRVDAPTAWLTTSGAGVAIAVIDTGVQCPGHPDLAANLLPGYDAITGATGCPASTHPHGTHVAGIAAAVGNNGIGGAGVAHGARIVPVRVLDDQGGGEDSDVAAGMVWAADHGAAVMNISLGGEWDSPSLRAATAYAIDRGVVLVAAAGNEGSSRRFYPAAYDGVVSVGATNSGDRRTDWSNHGAWVSLGAPGETILSTCLGGKYCSMSGTSMSTPIVAGVVALMLARSGQASYNDGAAAVVSGPAPRPHLAGGATWPVYTNNSPYGKTGAGAPSVASRSPFLNSTVTSAVRTVFESNARLVSGATTKASIGLTRSATSQKLKPGIMRTASERQRLVASGASNTPSGKRSWPSNGIGPIVMQGFDQQRNTTALTNRARWNTRADTTPNIAIGFVPPARNGVRKTGAIANGQRRLTTWQTENASLLRPRTGSRAIGSGGDGRTLSANIAAAVESTTRPARRLALRFRAGWPSSDGDAGFVAAKQIPWIMSFLSRAADRIGRRIFARPAGTVTPARARSPGASSLPGVPPRPLSLSPAAVKAILMSTSDPCNCGWQAGRVNARRAVGAVPAPPTATKSTPNANPATATHTGTARNTERVATPTDRSTPTVTATRPGYPPPATATAPVPGGTPTLAPGCVRLAPWPGIVLCREVQ